jgi:hypothetical protein
MYDLNHLDSQHRETLDRVTDLLQKFMERLETLRKSCKLTHSDSPEYLERCCDQAILKIIQWVRYLLKGDSIEIASMKTSGLINQRMFKGYQGVNIYPWIQEALGLKEGEIEHTSWRTWITYRNLILHIVDTYFPRDGSLFDLMGGDYGSVRLHEIKKEILEFIG